MLHLRSYSLFLISFLPALSFADAIGTVASLSGVATLNAKPLSVGAGINEGDKIETAPNGRVKLLMKDQTVVDLSPSSNFEVKKYDLKSRDGRQIEVGSDLGTIRSLVNKRLEKKGRFNFRTRTSVLAVRGTEFFVVTPPGSAPENITVTEGALHVAPDGMPSLDIGTSQQWAGGNVTDVSGREVASVADNGRVSDNTFDSFVVVSSGGESGGNAGRDTLGTVRTTFTPPAEIPVKMGDFVDAQNGRSGPTQDSGTNNIVNRTDYSLKVKFNP